MSSAEKTPIYCLCFEETIENVLINQPGSNPDELLKASYPSISWLNMRCFSLRAACAVDPDVSRAERIVRLLERLSAPDQLRAIRIRRIIVYIVSRLLVLMHQLKTHSSHRQPCLADQAHPDNPYVQRVSPPDLRYLELLSLILNGLAQFDCDREPELLAQATCDICLRPDNRSEEAQIIRKIIVPINNNTGFLLLFRHPQDCFDVQQRFVAPPPTITKDSCTLYIWPVQATIKCPLVDQPEPTLKVSQLSKRHTASMHQLDADEPIDLLKQFCVSDIPLDKTLMRLMEYFKKRMEQNSSVISFRVLGKVGDLIDRRGMSAHDVHAVLKRMFDQICFSVAHRVQLEEIAASQPFNTKVVSPKCVLDITIDNRKEELHSSGTKTDNSYQSIQSGPQIDIGLMSSSINSLKRPRSHGHGNGELDELIVADNKANAQVLITDEQDDIQLSAQMIDDTENIQSGENYETSDEDEEDNEWLRDLLDEADRARASASRSHRNLLNQPSSSQSHRPKSASSTKPDSPESVTQLSKQIDTSKSASRSSIIFDNNQLYQSPQPPLYIGGIKPLIDGARAVAAKGFAVHSAIHKRFKDAENSFLDLQNTKLSIAVCGARGAGKSQLINSLAFDQSIAGSLWGKLPLPSGMSAERVVEAAPTHLIHSPHPFMRFIWKDAGLDHTSNQSNKDRVPNNPCVDPAVSFVKNVKGEWQSECWSEVRHRYSNLVEIKDRGFLDLYHQAKNEKAQVQLLDFWAINQFFFGLESWFGGRRSFIVRIEIGMPHWSFHQGITLIDIPGWEDDKRESSSAALQLIDGVILVGRRVSGSAEVKTLLEYGAFNQSKQSVEGTSAWKPPFLLSMYQANSTLTTGSQSQLSANGNSAGSHSHSIVDETKLRRNLSDDMRLLSQDPSVLPLMSRWDGRVEHFGMIVQNSFFCPLVSDPQDQAGQLSVHSTKLAQSVTRFVSAIQSERCWSVLNQLSTFVILACGKARAKQRKSPTSQFDKQAKLHGKESTKARTRLTKSFIKRLNELADSCSNLFGIAPWTKRQRKLPDRSHLISHCHLIFDEYVTELCVLYEKELIHTIIPQFLHKGLDDHMHETLALVKNLHAEYRGAQVQSRVSSAYDQVQNTGRNLLSDATDVKLKDFKSKMKELVGQVPIELTKTLQDLLDERSAPITSVSPDVLKGAQTECDNLKAQIQKMLADYSAYVDCMRSYVIGESSDAVKLTGKSELSALIPQGADLYNSIAEFLALPNSPVHQDVTGYDVSMHHVPSYDHPQVAIMKTRFDTNKNELVLSTSENVSGRVRAFKQKFAAVKASSSDSQSSQPSSSSIEYMLNMFGESDQVHQRTLFPIYTICWTVDEHSFDDSPVIHSNWDGLPYCHFLLVEPGEQSQKLVASLKRSANSRDLESGMKIVVELPSVNMLPQYAIDIGKHIMEYFDFDFCWRVYQYARTREKHSIMIETRQCTLARSMFSMQVATSRLFDYVTILLAEKMRTHKNMLLANISDIVELKTVGLSRADGRALERRETSTLTSLLERLSTSDFVTSTAQPSDEDIFSLVRFFSQVEVLLKQQPDHENIVELQKACSDLLFVVQPWLRFRVLSFCLAQWILPQVMPDFPLVHSVKASSVHARIMVLEHVRSLRGTWMADQKLQDDIWTTSKTVQKSMKKGKKKVYETNSWTLHPRDVYHCESTYGTPQKSMQHGPIMVVTSFGVEYTNRMTPNKVPSENSASSASQDPPAKRRKFGPSQVK